MYLLKKKIFFPTSVLKWSKSVRGEINYTFSGKQWICFRVLAYSLYFISEENTFIQLLKVQITQQLVCSLFNFTLFVFPNQQDFLSKAQMEKFWTLDRMLISMQLKWLRHNTIFSSHIFMLGIDKNSSNYSLILFNSSGLLSALTKSWTQELDANEWINSLYSVENNLFTN